MSTISKTSLNDSNYLLCSVTCEFDDMFEPDFESDYLLIWLFIGLFSSARDFDEELYLDECASDFDVSTLLTTSYY